ncbi:MAG: hypothetical protein WDZ28_00525 [Simkaniaceae bacterium]
MSEVSGAGGISPKDMQSYKQEFHKSVDIFKESLEEYHQTGEGPKKEAFKKAMDESLHIMDQLGPIFSKEIQQQKATLEGHYSDFTSKESDSGFNQLETDIKSLDDKIG